MSATSGKPPHFRLPDGQGRETALADFLGRRIVLAFDPSRVDLDALSTHRAGLDERDIVVLAILPPGHSLLFPSPPVLMLIDHGGRVASEYGVPADRPFFCLIGRDGTIKEAGQDFPTPAELFGMVDAMPMRRQEMRRQEIRRHEMRDRGMQERG